PEDDDILEAIRAGIEDSGLLTAVLVGRPAEHAFGADDLPAAFVYLARFSEPASPAAYGRLHHATFEIQLWERDDDDATRRDDLQKYLAACRAAVNGRELAGATIAGLTVLDDSRIAPPDYPNQGWVVPGRYAYKLT